MARTNITELSRRFEAVNQAYRNIPSEIAAIAVNFSKERFRKQAWQAVQYCFKWSILSAPGGAMAFALFVAALNFGANIFVINDALNIPAETIKALRLPASIGGFSFFAYAY